MAQKDKHQQLPREDQAPSGVAQLEAGAGPPKMKRKEYERVSPRFLQLTPGVEKAMADDGIIISHLLSQVPYKPPAPRDITLPRRQPAHGYVQPDLPLRYIPAPF